MWLTHVPLQGERAHSARELLHAYKNPPGVEQHVAFWQDPLIVHRLCLKKPERIEAFGLVLVLALLLGRLVERALRVHVETTGTTLTGGDKKATQKPTAFMMMTKCATVMVSTVGAHRQLAPSLSPTPPAISLGVERPCDVLHRTPEWMTRRPRPGETDRLAQGAMNWRRVGQWPFDGVRSSTISRLILGHTERLKKEHREP